MTHERGYGLGLQFLNICNNIQQKNIFCHTTYPYALVLVRNEYGFSVFKKVITIADDLFKHEFLDLIARRAFSLSEKDLGISLIQHVLNLDFTRKQNHTRLHGLMAEFDEILSTTSDTTELHKLALKLTSDSDLFVEFVKTKRGSLMVQVMLGKSEEIDMTFLEAITKQRFTDVTTSIDGYQIKSCYDCLKECRQILHLIGVHALYLTKNVPVGNKVIQDMLNANNLICTEHIAFGLSSHYIELSFLKHGSDIVEKLLRDKTGTGLPLHFMVMEIVNCHEDTLVRLAKDEYGNKVLRKTFEVAKEHGLFTGLVRKLKPLLDRLRGSHGENIAEIVSLGNHQEIYSQLLV